MKKRLRIMSILLTLVMAISLFSGCAEIEKVFNQIFNPVVDPIEPPDSPPDSPPDVPPEEPPEEPPLILSEDELSIHFMMLGNDYAGDSTYIKAGDIDILIDAGSRINSVPYISGYMNNYVTDGKLEYVIVTHSDQDHIDGFVATSKQQSIFDLYECETIIDFNLTNKKMTTDSGNPTLYAKYLTSRDAEVAGGATHYTALDCYNNQNGAQRVYELSDSISMEILYNYYYDHKASDENDYSVCVLFRHGSKAFLFTGDLEESGEEYLVQYNTLPQVELYKAGHHGSPTSSNDCLLSVIKPKISVACCCAGSVEYTDNLANTFPSQAYIDRIAPYTDCVYVPVYIEIMDNPDYNPDSSRSKKYKNSGEYKLLNGNIVVYSPADTKDENDNIIPTAVTVIGSNNSTKLKDTDWFKANRTMPSAWLN